MALHHFCTIASNIRESVYFALESDQVTDSSNKEQVIVCLRWVDSQLEQDEDFVGLHYVDDITTNTIVHVLYCIVVYCIILYCIVLLKLPLQDKAGMNGGPNKIGQ